MTDFFASRLDERIATVTAMRNDDALMNMTESIAEAMIEVLRSDNKIMLCGNGGSAADAQHIAAEFVSRFYCERRGLPAEALTTNTSSLTAIANDYGYEQVFARQVEAQGRRGDILVGITTSGSSPNVVAAFAVAREKGIKTVAFTGAAGKTRLEGKVDMIIAIPSDDTPRIQEAHITLGHLLCEYVEAALFSTPSHEEEA